MTISSQPAPGSFSSIVPLRPSGSLPPLFLIHGVGGDIPDFGTLFQKLDPRYPVYGIESQAFDPSSPALTTLEEIAAYQLRAIRQVHPHGPYGFIGFSFGGMVAFEMAQQLNAAGERPLLVGMIDSCEMSYLKRESQRTAPTAKAAALSRRLQTRFREAFLRPDTLAYVKEKIQSRLFRMLYSVVSTCGFPIPHRLQNAYHVNWFAAVNYVPRRYPGRITLFKARNHFWEAGIPDDLGWGPWAAEGVELFEIPGDHVSTFIEPNVSVLAHRLTEALESAALASAALENGYSELERQMA